MDIANLSDKINERCEMFNEKGYVVIKNFFEKEKLIYLKTLVIDNINKTYKNSTFNGFSTLLVTYHTEINLFTYFTRDYNLLNLLDALFETKMTCDHSKLPRKLAGSGGFKPHQDSWYWQHTPWYKSTSNTCSVFIALEDSTPESGCPEIYEASHKMIYNDKKTAKQEIKKFNKVNIPMECGDILIFHGNTIHSSKKNYSSKSRLMLIGCYNSVDSISNHDKLANPRYIDSSTADIKQLSLPNEIIDCSIHDMSRNEVNMFK